MDKSKVYEIMTELVKIRHKRIALDSEVERLTKELDEALCGKQLTWDEVFDMRNQIESEIKS